MRPPQKQAVDDLSSGPMFNSTID